jgi:Protein of unknown function (DUF4230)
MIRFSLKQWVFILCLVLIALFGMWYWLKYSIFTPIQHESTTIMLEKIKTVTKLVNVEGQFSELYTHGEEYNYDFFGLFTKKVILRVTAKVSVGYDFEKVNMKIDSIAKTVTLNNMPVPQILSVDHDLDYYDITQGTFNEFTTAEYNTINKNAKEKIVKNAAIPQLLAKAEAQKIDYLRMMDIALKSAGWKLVITDPLAPNL